MSDSSHFERMQRWLRRGYQPVTAKHPLGDLYYLTRADVYGVLTEWTDAQAALRWRDERIDYLTEQLYGKRAMAASEIQPPAWTVIA